MMSFRLELYSEDVATELSGKPGKLHVTAAEFRDLHYVLHE
jgi:hypothetical protein